MCVVRRCVSYREAPALDFISQYFCEGTTIPSPASAIAEAGSEGRTLKKIPENLTGR